MKIHSLALGALVLSVLAPAAFAASSGDNSWLYRDKPNNGGATMSVTTDTGGDTAAFAVVGGQRVSITGPAGDYWPGKSGNGYN